MVGSAAAGAPATLSFGEFEDLQREYCDKFVSELNESVDWHLAIDVSGSYEGSLETLAATAADILASLPLETGDSLWIDNFGSGYRTGTGPGPLAADWIDDFHAGSTLAQSAILSWLPAVANPSFDSHTDLERLPDQIAGLSHAGCRGRRSYFVVLTDGKNTPDRPRVPSLFGHTATGACIAERVVRLAAPVAATPPARPIGTLFVIDTRYLGRDDARRSRHEWGQVGQRELRRHLQAHPPMALVPEIVTWAAVARDDQVLGRLNRRRLAREDGLFACLLPPNVERDLAASPEADGFPQATGRHRPMPGPKLLGCLTAQPGCALAIPKDALFADSPRQALSLVFLARGRVTRTLQVTSQSWPDGSAKATGTAETRRIEVAPPYVGPGWRTYEVVLDLTFDEDTLARRPPPWRLSLAFGDHGKPHEFLGLQLRGGLHSGVLPDMLDQGVRDGLRSLPRRGRLFAILTIVPALASWILTYRRTLKLLVQVTPEGLPGAPPYRGVYHQRHLRYSFTRKEVVELWTSPSSSTVVERRGLWRKVFRRDGPTIAAPTDGAHDEVPTMELDVIPLYGMVYHVVHYQEAAAPSFALDHHQHLDQFDTGVAGVIGLFTRPASFWRRPQRNPAAPEQVGPGWRQRLRSRLDGLIHWMQPLPLEWQQEVLLPGEEGGRPVTITTLLTPVLPRDMNRWKSWWYAARHAYAIALCTDLAVVCALLALASSFNLDVPASFSSILEQAAKVWALALGVRFGAHALTCEGRAATLRRMAKCIFSTAAVATIMLGIFLPFASSSPAPIRWLIGVAIVVSCVSVALGMHPLVRRRIRTKTPLSNVDLVVEWFMRISPVVF